jgi:hypothetical protein
VLPTTFARKEIGEIGIVEDHPELIVEVHDGIRFGEDGVGDAGGVGRHQIDGLRLQRHHGPPKCG